MTSAAILDRHELDDEHTQIRAQAVSDHLPYELARPSPSSCSAARADVALRAPRRGWGELELVDAFTEQALAIAASAAAPNTRCAYATAHRGSRHHPRESERMVFVAICARAGVSRAEVERDGSTEIVGIRAAPFESGAPDRS